MDFDDGAGGSSRGGRVRKKSAKVLEMEEAEQLEKKITSTKKPKPRVKMTQLKAVEKSPTKLVLQVNSPQEEKADPDPPSPMAEETVSPLTLTLPQPMKTDPEEEDSPLPEVKDEPDFFINEEVVKTAKKRKKSGDHEGKPPKSAKKKPKDSPISEPMGSVSGAPELLAALSTAPDPIPCDEEMLEVKKEEMMDDSMDEGDGMDDEDDPEDDEDDDDDEEDDDDDDDHDEGTNESEESSGPIYANTEAAAMKLKTQAEKKAGKIKKGSKSAKNKQTDKEPKKRRPTAYTMWCGFYRSKVVDSNPGIDFGSISKRLGDIWQALPEKDKMAWRRKAKSLASKGSTLISTGKQPAKKAAPQKPASSPAAQVMYGPSGNSHLVSLPTTHDDDSASSTLNISPLMAAAHLKLLGESLGTIGARLQEHKGQIAVQGSLSVLLDSLICALGPLQCLANEIPELEGVAVASAHRTMEDITYIMPGIG